MKFEVPGRCNNINVDIYIMKSFTGNSRSKKGSKTCSNCGNLKENLRGNHNYNCNKCGININRDINGARNIYIKTLL